jgi:hypothetical protein
MSWCRRTKRTEKREEKTRITYFVETNKKVMDVTVKGYVDASPQQSVESTRSYVLSLMQGVLKRDQEGFVRWWVEDESGHVLESHDDFSPPAKPSMMS